MVGAAATWRRCPSSSGTIKRLWLPPIGSTQSTPPDDTGSGKELRLKQQYFFVSATLQDIMRRYKRERNTFTDFGMPLKVCSRSQNVPERTHSLHAAKVSSRSEGCSARPQPSPEHSSWDRPTSSRNESLA